jgi:hypothetical protein
VNLPTIFKIRKVLRFSCKATLKTVGFTADRANVFQNSISLVEVGFLNSVSLGKELLSNHIR